MNSGHSGIWFLSILVILFCLCCSCECRERKVSISGRTSRKSSSAGQPCDVVEKGLVEKKSISYKKILNNHSTYCKKEAHIKNFARDTLVYVTPWNNHGYDIAKWFNGKFTYISPVWYQLRPGRFTNSDKPTLHGQHDVDVGWLNELWKGPVGAPDEDENAEENAESSNNAKSARSVIPKITPRFLFDGWSTEDFKAMFYSEEMREYLVSLVVNECLRIGYNGAVLELGYLPSSMFGDNYHKMIISMANQLHNNQREIILVVPAMMMDSKIGQPFVESDFVRLHPYVDRFQLMTYDYTKNHENKFGPSAPLSWITHSVLSIVPQSLRSSSIEKIMIGINFYGIDYNLQGIGEPIIGKQLIEILEKYKPKISWDEGDGEHKFNYMKFSLEHLVYFPSLAYIKARLDLAEGLGCGIALWEIGQGLDYNFDLL